MLSGDYAGVFSRYRNKVITSACLVVSGLFFEIPNRVTVYLGTFQNMKNDFIGTVFVQKKASR